jgi:23S rRNA (pseudouridine1915-N3)-methyltransferase
VRIAILAIGRLGRSPEADLVRLYAERATAAGRALGLGPVEVIEVEGRKPGKGSEAEALSAHLADSRIIACDERGRARSSRDFAAEIGRLRDDGVRRLAFGPQTWPHALARVMLAEQVYRSVTLLAGGPYHRD